MFIYLRENGPATCFNEKFYEEVLSVQLSARRFPDHIIPSDFKRDYHENGGDVTHSLHIWDNRDNDVGINLKPGYDVDKVRM